ncbi:MAG: hypothetical protein ACK5JS_03535 [Mangrovibacterium sp.]
METSKDRFEEEVRKHQADFERDLPDGHGARFLAKLETKKTKTLRKKIVWKYAQVAAALVVGFLLATFMHSDPFPKKDFAERQKPTSEVEEMEIFYTSSINAGERRLKHFADIGMFSEEEQQAMLKEYAEFQENFKMLSNDLEASGNDERVVQAMVRMYKVRLEVIEKIIDELELKQCKMKSHEYQM